MSRSLIIVDSNVIDYETWLSGLNLADVEIRVLESGSDGLEQIADYLRQSSTPFDTLHVVSHGREGGLYLGDTLLTLSTLEAYQARLIQIGQGLTPNGDILLYGCSVASGDEGVQFIQILSVLTGADIAASTNPSGPAALGGDSLLEVVSGSVEAVALNMDAMGAVLAANQAPTFGKLADGTVLTDGFGAGAKDDSIGYSINVQADGKILVAGDSNTGGVRGFALARYNADGSLDANFGSSGKVITNYFRSATARGLTIQSDGKIVVAGTGENNLSDADILLVRYNPDGTLDTTFSADGLVNTDFGGNEYGTSVAVQSNGKILVAGYSVSTLDFVLARYNADGSLDVTFSADGKQTTNLGGNDYGFSLMIQADGKILVAGDSTGDVALVRYNTDGSLDPTFSNDGKLTTNLGGIERGIDVVIQADGKILVAGSNNSDFALIRYNTDGSLDAAFGSGGTLTTDFGGADYGSSVALQSDGKILVSGLVINNANYDFALARYNSDGSLDPSFNFDGLLTTDFGGTEVGLSLVVQADGKILIAGKSDADGSNDFALARYNPDGSLDTSFGLSYGLLDGAPAYSENGRDVVLDDTVQVFDPDLRGSSFSGTTLTLARHGGANPEDRFSGAGIVAGQTIGTITTGGATIGVYTWDSGTLTLRFNNTATQERVNQALQSLAYSNNTDAPATSVQIDWTFNDGNAGDQGTGGPLSVTGSTIVAITPVNDPPAGTVQVLGAAMPGRVLVASDTLADPDGLGSITYNWYAGGSNTLLATGIYYTPTGADVGQTITVVASYVDAMGTAERVTSLATIPVIAEPAPVTVDTPVQNGTDDAEYLLGTRRNDTLNAGGGDDLLAGKAGADRLDGAEGSDLYLISSAVEYARGEIISDTGNAGIDELRFDSGRAATLRLFNVSGVELLTLGAGNVASTIDASALSESLTILGNDGRNTLKAGSGDDTLNGKIGADKLTGGRGVDTFVFAAGDSGQVRNLDVITDYTKGVAGRGDVIDYLSNLDVGGTIGAATPNLAFINPDSGVTTFFANSGKTMTDALEDIAASLTLGGDVAGSFALFQVNGKGAYHLFISDGLGGVTAGDVVVQLLGVTSVSGIDLTDGNLTITG